MLYVYALILEIIIKYVYLKYSFDNAKLLINKEISKDFSGNIFSNPDSFYLNKANKAIIENSKNIQHFQETLKNYNNYIFHDIFLLNNNKTKFEILPASFNNKIHLFYLVNSEEKYLNDFCSSDLIFKENEKVLKIILLEKNTLAILFSNTNLILYEFSFTFKSTRNLLLNPLENNKCFLDKIEQISPVKDIFKLTQAEYLFMTLNFFGKIDFYNLKDYLFSRYHRYEIIKSIQLGCYDHYYFAEIGLNHRFLLSGYHNRITLIKIGMEINIQKIYFLNNEIVSSLYSLDNYQILLGTNQGNIHLISVENSQLVFDGALSLCNGNNIELIAQEKKDYLICIKCGNKFKLIDLNGKFSEKDFENDKYKEEFILVVIILLISIIIKITKGKIVSFFKNNNDNDEND